MYLFTRQLSNNPRTRIAVFSTKRYDKHTLEPAFKKLGFNPFFLESALSEETVILAENYQVVCVFVNDDLNSTVISYLAGKGLKHILLRCAGYNNVDLAACKEFGIKVARVPAYSPHAVAEFAVGQILMLNRKLHLAYARARAGNFNLEGLTGFDLSGKTAGIIGTGKIGRCVIEILSKGFGMNVICYDLYPTEGYTYVDLPELLKKSDVISLHCPLSPETKYIINANTIEQMKTGVMLINSSRGGLIDTKALISGLKSRKIGSVALDVYEDESDLFFKDSSSNIIQDDVFSRLLTFPNVSVTGHQAFLTREALDNIAEATAANCSALLNGKECPNLVSA
ncbi:hypothetical protein CANCADRAFT_124248 [Tortispora caseinolytica NRRL Y-17796]|uniref:D-lactate dehydrogenase n=1 Tax=Tortispora caseinolytica NRRL Y-17796 TaxID=767744 RepID=A0A1E4TA47_9ASCO|nr:hypothetical protein CANCADRAFT_124248 [Tortispora caseinolytica NRRL Y-17796]